MSQQNVQIVRRGNDAFRRGDWDAVAANLDPHILIRADTRWPEQQIYGRDAVMAWYRDVREALGPDVHVEEIVDLGDRLLIRVCWIVRGQQSGVGGELRWSEITTYRDGRAIFAEMFLEHEQALKAVGLTE